MCIRDSFRLPFRKLRLMADVCPTGPWFKESVGVRVLLKNNHNMSNALGFERLRGNPVCGRNSGLVWEILSCLRKGQLEYMMRGSNNLFKLESVLLNGLLVWHIQLYLYPILANEENRVEKTWLSLKNLLSVEATINYSLCCCPLKGDGNEVYVCFGKQAEPGLNTLDHIFNNDFKKFFFLSGHIRWQHDCHIQNLDI